MCFHAVTHVPICMCALMCTRIREQDLRDECGKYGVVTGIDVPRPGQPGTGYAFVRYATVDEGVKVGHCYHSSSSQ
jgi:RNA recognition motif-containing protein